MPARISITPEDNGVVRFEGRLRALEGNLAAFPLAAESIMKALEEYTRKTWGQGVEVTETTRQRWPDWKALERTGELKASLTQSGAKGAVRTITPYGFTWGSSLIYAKFLYKGTSKMSPKPVVQSVRAIRAVAGYYMRQFLLRNAIPLEGGLNLDTYAQSSLRSAPRSGLGTRGLRRL